MGRSGCAFVKYSTDCACTSGKLPSGTWLGTVYRCNHPGCECTGQTDCIHAVGKTGTEQNSDADQSKASDFDSTASKPTVCVPGIFRMQAFQQGEWIFAGEWCGTNWLADWEYIKTDGILPSEKTSEMRSAQTPKAPGLLWKNLSYMLCYLEVLSLPWLYLKYTNQLWTKYEHNVKAWWILRKSAESQKETVQIA